MMHLCDFRTFQLHLTDGQTVLSVPTHLDTIAAVIRWAVSNQHISAEDTVLAV